MIVISVRLMFSFTNQLIIYRYGFLEDAFSSRGVPGKIYGGIESSMFLGYGTMFLSGAAEYFMRRYKSRDMMIVIMCVHAVASLATGLVYMLDNITAVIVISTVIRVLQGALNYSISLISVDFINAQFPEKFDVINGFLNMGYYVGHGVAESVGCVLYDRFGYVAPYIFSFTFAVLACVVVFFVIPRSKTYLSSQDYVEERLDSLTQPAQVSMTKMLIFPMIATMMINANYGYIQVRHTYIS